MDKLDEYVELSKTAIESAGLVFSAKTAKFASMTHREIMAKMGEFGANDAMTKTELGALLTSVLVDNYKLELRCLCQQRAALNKY